AWGGRRRGTPSDPPPIGEQAVPAPVEASPRRGRYPDVSPRLPSSSSLQNTTAVVGNRLLCAWTRLITAAPLGVQHGPISEKSGGRRERSAITDQAWRCHVRRASEIARRRGNDRAPVRAE